MFSWWRRWSRTDTLQSAATATAAPGDPRHDAEGKLEHANKNGKCIDEADMKEGSADLSSSESEETTPKAKPADGLGVATSEIPKFELKDCSSAPDGLLNEANSSKSENTRRQSQQNDAAGPKVMAPPPVKPPSLSPASTQGQSSLAPPPSRVQFMPPPPRPTGGSLRPPASAASSLRAPVNRSITAETLSPRPGRLQSSRSVPLEPGHSPLDWAALTTNPANSQRLRGDNVPVNTYLRVTPSMLKAHHGRKGTNAWTSYMGKVYNITPYIPFHPGGKGELLRCAGKDAARLFNEVHPWVNWDGMLGECLVGILVSDNDALVNGSPWEEMD
ncbi:hypothetical protein KEM56_000109 [Ascosphaera pollenicola]|nr:hypothetical protein KEM56_000109 [Ascosphaera pollenicola]